MPGHAGNFTEGVLASAFYLAVSLSVSAVAAGVSPPDFAPNPSVGWLSATSLSSPELPLSPRTRLAGRSASSNSCSHR